MVSNILPLNLCHEPCLAGLVFCPDLAEKEKRLLLRETKNEIA